MDDARLSEIERKNRCEGHSIRDGDMPDADNIFYCGPNNADIVELIAEVRRLKAELKTEYELNDEACRNGVESGHEDIVDIIGKGAWNGDPDTIILAQIKSFLCIDDA